jgi:hypothetical protein
MLTLQNSFKPLLLGGGGGGLGVKSVKTVVTGNSKKAKTEGFCPHYVQEFGLRKEGTTVPFLNTGGLACTR